MIKEFEELTSPVNSLIQICETSANSSLSDNHALRELIREDAINLTDLLKDIPAEKLADLRAMIGQLHNK